MIPFDDVRLPADIEQGSRVGPMFQTTIVPLSSGAEQRNADWAQEKLSADISYGVMAKNNPHDNADSFAAVMRFYRARMGRWRGFRFRDWSDYQIENEPVTMLTPSYGLLTVEYEDNYRRIITRPDVSTLSFSTGPQTAWQLLPGGLILFNSPPGAGVRYGCEFDVPMRFDSDLAQVSLYQIEAGEIPSIKLVQCPDPMTPDKQELLKNAQF
jgi:uncharacterized protein (TIGR02217 family)